jgi:hypothetical protein
MTAVEAMADYVGEVLEFIQSPAVLVLAMAAAAVGLFFVLRRRLGKFTRYGLLIAWSGATGLLLAGVWTGAWEAPLATHSDPYSGCIGNLKVIRAAKKQWALENKKTTGELSDYAAINRYLKNSQAPACSSGGLYSYNPVGTEPTCSFGGDGHNLDPARGRQESLQKTERANYRLLGMIWLAGCLTALMLPRSWLLWGTVRRSQARPS